MSKEKPTKHFYAIVPNGSGYIVEWGTRNPDKKHTACYVPASGDRDKGIYFGVNDTLDECIRGASTVNEGKYDVIKFRRVSGNRHSDDYWRFEADRWIVNGYAGDGWI